MLPPAAAGGGIAPKRLTPAGERPTSPPLQKRFRLGPLVGAGGGGGGGAPGGGSSSGRWDSKGSGGGSPGGAG